MEKLVIFHPMYIYSRNLWEDEIYEVEGERGLHNYGKVVKPF